MRRLGLALLLALAVAPAARAAGPPLLSADTSRVDVASDRGSGVFGSWRVDSDGLPLYRYTLDEETSKFAPQSELGGNRAAWHQLGNDHINADAYNHGYVELWSQDRHYQWANHAAPDSGHYAGGYGYLNVDGKVYSTLYDDRAKDAQTERDFGVGYFRRAMNVDGIDTEEHVYAPFGDDPLLLHDVTITNTSDHARAVSWFEYWDVNAYTPGTKSYRALEAPAYDGATRTLSVAHSADAIDSRPLSIFAAALRGPVDGWDTSVDAFFGSGGRAAPAEVAANKLSQTLAPPAPVGAAGKTLMAFRAPLRLAPGQSATLRYAYGIAHAEQIGKLVAKWRDAGDPLDTSSRAWAKWRDPGDPLDTSSRAWAKWLPQASFGSQYDWLSRELQWDAYILRSGTTYDEGCGHHIISQGGYYQYDDGAQIAYRDPLQHMLPMIYADPEIAREVIRYSAREQPQAGGQIAYGTIPMCQRLDLGSSDDLDVWLLYAAAEYGLATHDTKFFDEKIPWQDAGDATIWDHLRAAYRHQESQRGPHGGYVIGATGDWSDFSTQFMQMTESMLVATQTAYTYPLLAQLADERGDRAFADELRVTAKGLDDVLRKEWTGKGWFSRGYSGDRQLGKGVIYGEPQPWGLLAGVPTAAQSDTLVANIRRFLTGVGAPGGPTKIGSAQSPAANDPEVTETSAGGDGGIGNHHAVYVGGTWFSLTGSLVWALGEHGDRDYAFDEFLRNTLAQHATVYPEHWDGVISVDDACRVWYSDDPQVCGIGLTTAYNTQIMHQPAWALFDLVKLAGLQGERDGWRVLPRLPMKTFSVRLPDVGVAAEPGLLRGYVTPGRTGTVRLRVAAPEGDGLRAYVDGKPVAAPVHDGLVELAADAQPGRALDFAVVTRSAARCASRRRFPVRVGRTMRLRRIEIYRGARRVRVARARGRRGVVDLRGLPRDTLRVRLVGASTRSGRRVVRVRRYRTCTRRGA